MTTINTEISSHALGAKSIKKELSESFKGVKFSVKSKSFSMGNSIDVSWEFGPTCKEVDLILKKYELGSFDGMTDLYTYEKNNFAKEFGGAKYVMSYRSFGECWVNWENSFYGTIGKALCELQQIPFKGQNQREIYGSNDIYRDLGQYVNELLSRTSFKPGQTTFDVKRANGEIQILEA